MKRRTTNKPSKRQAAFKFRTDRRYLAFFKPYGVLSQFSQPENSEKATLAEFHFPPDVYPIGRLDWDSEGLLVLSDDGALNHALLDPMHSHARTYFVQVENIPDATGLDRLQKGVVIEGLKTRPAHAALIDPPHLPERPVPIRFRKNIPTAWIALTIAEGRNRQVRKMTAAVGTPTLRLVRISIGNLLLEKLELKPGEWCYLNEQQVSALFGD